MSPHGQTAVSVALQARTVSPDPLHVAKVLQRELDLPTAYRQAASLQAELRERLVQRWGAAPDFLLTRDGIEQATHPAIRAWRTERFLANGVERVADLGCGIGFESGNFAAAGMGGWAVDRDLETAAIAAMNLRGSGIQVLQFDVVEDAAALGAVLADVDAVFVDPARRDPKAARTVDGRSGNRVSDPEDWSPAWSWVLELGERHGKVVAKVAPGIDKELLPEGAQTVWFAVRGSLAEASVWWPAFGYEAQRVARAVSRHGDVDEIDDLGESSEQISEVGAFLLDPSPAVTRAGLVTQLAARVGAARIDEHLGFLTTAVEPEDSPLFTTYEVLQTLPLDEAEVAKALHAVGARDVQVSARGWGGDIDALTARLKKGLTGDKVISVLIARLAEQHLAVLAQRLN